MTQLRKLAGQTAIYGISTIAGRMLNYFLYPLYTYQFTDPREIGVLTEFYAYVSFLNILATYGMETAFFNFSVKQDNPKNVFATGQKSLLFSTALLCIPLLFLAPLIASGLGYENHPEYIIWVVLIIATDAICAIPFAKLRQEGKAKMFAIIKNVNIGVNILLNLFFIGLCKSQHDAGEGIFASFYNPEIGIGYVFLSNLVANIVSIIFLYDKILPRGVFDTTLLKSMLRYSAPLLIVGFAGMINETLDRILLKYLLPENISLTQVGIYGACYKISILMSIFIQAFRYAAEPFFFGQSKGENAKKGYADIMKYFVIACSIIFLGTMMNMQWIKYFLHRNFWSGLDVVPILLIANLFLGVYFNLSIWYKLTQKTGYGAFITVVGALVTLALNFFWIPRIGFVGSAWATLICYGSMMVLSYILGRKHYDVDYPLGRIALYFALSVTLFFAGSIIDTGKLAVDLLLKNGLCISFILMVFFLERKNLRIA